MDNGNAGLDPDLLRRWDSVVLRCAENIAQWTLEHQRTAAGGMVRELPWRSGHASGLATSSDLARHARI